LRTIGLAGIANRKIVGGIASGNCYFAACTSSTTIAAIASIAILGSVRSATPDASLAATAGHS
jgi:hypothetical protein